MELTSLNTLLDSMDSIFGNEPELEEVCLQEGFWHHDFNDQTDEEFDAVTAV